MGRCDRKQRGQAGATRFVSIGPSSLYGSSSAAFRVVVRRWAACSQSVKVFRNASRSSMSWAQRRRAARRAAVERPLLVEIARETAVAGHQLCTTPLTAIPTLRPLSRVL